MSEAGNPKARRPSEAGQRPLHGTPEPAPLSWAAVEHALDDLLTLPGTPGSRWHRAGLSERRERWFERAAAVLLVVFATGWSWTMVQAATGDRAGLGAHEPGALAVGVTSRIASAVVTPGTPTLAYLTDAMVVAFTPLRGESGKLRATFQADGTTIPTDSLPAGATVALADARDTVALRGGQGADSRAARPGLWSVVVRAGNIIKPVADFTVIRLVPRSQRRNGRIGLYYIGTWPTEGGRTPRNARADYTPPSGFIEVTPANQDTWISEHFRLRDFLTKGQADVWPKYLVLQTRLVDKLELVLSDLQSRGIQTRGVRVMSGFRTPSYNASGGNTAGRAELSRHMYGDAADVFIDNDGNGIIDDLDGDGRITTADARMIVEAIERVERAHPALVGGAGLYGRGPGHGPFVHIDTRGYRARWLGSGE